MKFYFQVFFFGSQINFSNFEYLKRVILAVKNLLSDSNENLTVKNFYSKSTARCDKRWPYKNVKIIFSFMLPTKNQSESESCSIFS